jgi:hypothetical protein
MCISGKNPTFFSVANTFRSFSPVHPDARPALPRQTLATFVIALLHASTLNLRDAQYLGVLNDDPLRTISASPLKDMIAEVIQRAPKAMASIKASNNKVGAEGIAWV